MGFFVQKVQNFEPKKRACDYGLLQYAEMINFFSIKKKSSKF
jgi:hypothetical protein